VGQVLDISILRNRHRIARIDLVVQGYDDDARERLQAFSVRLTESLARLEALPPMKIVSLPIRLEPRWQWRNS